MDNIQLRCDHKTYELKSAPFFCIFCNFSVTKINIIRCNIHTEFIPNKTAPIQKFTVGQISSASTKGVTLGDDSIVTFAPASCNK